MLLQSHVAHVYQSLVPSKDELGFGVLELVTKAYLGNGSSLNTADVKLPFLLNVFV